MIIEFSIIIPVYNAEKFLSRCIESVLNQTFNNFELILINDGSTDNSGKVCDKYALQDNRIKIFHQKNSGVSAARNLGLENVQGEWVLFIDADDWVESNCLEIINNKIQFTEADLYRFGLRRLNDEKIRYVGCPPNTVKDNKSFIKSKNYRPTGCTYAFKNSIIKEWNFRFPIELKRAEDQTFLLKYISKIRNVVLINKILYNYWDHPDSTVNQQTDIHSTMSNILAANDVLNFCKQNNVDKFFYGHPVKVLYTDFFCYHLKMQNRNNKVLQKLYRTEYKKTIKIYPELKKNRFFRMAYYNISLAETILHKKAQIKNKIKKIFSKNK